MRTDGYYLINNKRVLYWQTDKWFKPLKSNGRYSGYISELENQPKKIIEIESYNIGF